MSEQPPRRRILLAAVLGILILLVFVGAAWYLTSAGFHSYVRARVVSDLENITGGRVELGNLQWNLSQLHITADELTIHGLEGPGEAPYVHADRLDMRLKIFSLLGRRFGFRNFEVDRPVIHIEVKANGTTNQPKPKVAQSGTSAIQQLFALQVDHAELRDGMLIVNDAKIPFQLKAVNVAARMSYAGGTQQYDGSLSMAGAHLRYGDYEPLDASLAAQFSLTRNQLDFRSLKISSGQSSIEASGRVNDFAHPRAAADYRGRLDLAQVGTITHLPQLRAGVVELDGQWSYAGQQFSSTGKAQLHGVEYRDPAIRVADLHGGADFVADSNRLLLPHLFVNALGGSITGNGSINHWLSALKPGARRGEVLPEAAALVKLQLHSLSVSRIAAAISTKSLPLERLNPVGSAAGTMEISWLDSPAYARAHFAVNVEPVAAASNQLPLRANIRGSYSIATLALQVDELNASARSVTLSASGAMARANNLRVALNAGDIRDITPVLASLSTSRLIEGMTGRLTFRGTLTGTLPLPQLSGHIGLDDFTFPIPLNLLAPLRKAAVPLPSAAPARRLAHFDSFAAEVEYSPSVLSLAHAQLRRGHERIVFSMRTALLKGEMYPAGVLTVHADVRNFEAGDLVGLLGYSYPVAGSVNGSVQVTGTADDPHGSGSFRITHAAIRGEPFQSVSADLLFANHEAQANRVMLTHNGATITGAGTYNLKTTAFRFDLHGVNFDLAQISDLQTPRMTMRGGLNFNARGSGTPEAPVVDADFHLRDLVLNGEKLGGMDVQATTRAGVMQLSSRSNFPAAELSIDGTVAMRDNFDADLALRFAHLDVDPLIHAFLRGRITGHSSITGAITLSGPLRQPRLLHVNGDISQLFADMEHMRIRNDGPLRFTMQDQVVRLDQVKLSGDEGTQFAATGTAALSGAKQLDLHLDGHVNLKLLQAWNPDLHTFGTVDFRVNARGTRARPQLGGQVKIARGSITHINFPNGLSEITGTLFFNQDRMQIQSLTATTGGGNINFTGFVTYSNLLAFNLAAEGRNIRLRYPQGMSTTMDVDLKFAGTTEASTLSGTATVTRFAMTPQFDLALAILKSKQPPEAPVPGSPLNDLRLAVHVTSTPELQLSTSLARITGDMDLNLRGTATRPVLLGRVNITEGKITFSGTTYQLERGDVVFSNPVRIEPVLDVEAMTRVREYEITLGFHGPLDRLSTTYRSEPPLPTSDIIALLAFGRTREESVMTTGPNPTFTESASNAILGNALSSASSSRVQRLFGVSRIKIAPEEFGEASVNPSARVTVEQQVSKDFTVTYISDLTRSTSQQQIVQVEYNYSRSVSIIAARDQYGVVSIDVRVRKTRR
ncbi:MAG: translocation/assembly module TamB domain-containing protein [Terriglobales bacterium]